MRNNLVARITRVAIGVAILAVASPLAAAPPVIFTYSSDLAFRAALGPSVVLTSENFDGFDDGTPFNDQTPGLVASSYNIESARCFQPLLVDEVQGATSGSNILFGGFFPFRTSLDELPIRQKMVFDFEPPISAVAFNLVDLDPNASAATVFLVLTSFENPADVVRPIYAVTNDTGSIENPIFFGVTSDHLIERVLIFSGVIESGLEGGGEGSVSPFGLDDLAFGEAGDTTPPLCSGTAESTEGGLVIFGSASDDRDGDSGLASIALKPGSENISFFVDEFEPGAGSVSFTAFATDGDDLAKGTVLVTDRAGLTCTLGLDFRPVPAGPITDSLTLCQEPGILFAVTNPNPTEAGFSACGSSLPSASEPSFPPGYEPSPADDPAPCTVFTIDSPITGSTTMIYKKDGTFDSRLRLLFSRSSDGGATFPPFNDVTESVEPILTIDPDPTRIKGTASWSPVKVTCALQTSPDCTTIDPALDFDGDGYPLCPAAGSGQIADCNDQRAFIHPYASELCNGLDDNCNGQIDEGNPGSDATCTVPTLKGACAAGRTSCIDGALACHQTIQPTTEICNGVDDDCNGRTDENYVFGGYLPPLRTDVPGVYKRGRTVPVKFQLTNCAGAFVPTAVARLQIFAYANQVIGTPVDDVSSAGNANTDDLFRYDPQSNQYIYNLGTSILRAGKSYLLRTVLDDGSTYDVVISIR